MHFTLKRIINDLHKYLQKGSEEQIVDVYEFVRAEYLKTEKGKKEMEEIAEQIEIEDMIEKRMKNYNHDNNIPWEDIKEKHIKSVKILKNAEIPKNLDKIKEETNKKEKEAKKETEFKKKGRPKKEKNSK